MARQRRNDPQNSPLDDVELARRMISGARRKLEDRLRAAGWNTPGHRTSSGQTGPGSPAGDASGSDLP